MGITARKLPALAREMEQVRLNMNYKLSGKEQIQRRLCETQVQVLKEAHALDMMTGSMQEILHKYQQTESRNFVRLLPPKVSRTTPIPVVIDGGFTLPWIVHPPAPPPRPAPWFPHILPIPPVRVLPWRPGTILPFPFPRFKPGVIIWKPPVLPVIDITSLFSGRG